MLLYFEPKKRPSSWYVIIMDISHCRLHSVGGGHIKYFHLPVYYIDPFRRKINDYVVPPRLNVWSVIEVLAP